MNKILTSLLSVGLLLISIVVISMLRSYPFISFSDTAKYADIASNIISGDGYTRNFTFFSGIKNTLDFKSTWLADWPPPVTPVLIALSSVFLGNTDFSVKFTTVLFYSATLLVIYLFVNKMYGKLSAVLAIFAIGFNYSILNYSVSGGTEIIFIFEIVLGFYLLSLSKKWADIMVLLISLLMYLTRPQFFIFCLGFLMFYLFNKYNFKKGFLLFMLITTIWMVIDIVLLSRVNGNAYLYSIFSFGSYGLSNASASDQLRGVSGQLNLLHIFSKLFYNLYNFYKALPDIMNPYLFALFIIGIFIKMSAFNISVLFMTGLTFLVTALTIPFYRYLHPVVPLIYIVAVATLVQIIGKFKFQNEKLKIIIATGLVLFFAVGQTLGVIFLDSRFERKLKNTDKAPIYVEMSYKLKEITGKDDVIVTNLDTWGSWYGERKTIWFPLEPSMILSAQENIDYIYLTSYKMDDENYYMGKEWREIFENPEKQTILSDYKFVAEYEFKATDNYERENGRAVLLLRNK